MVSPSLLVAARVAQAPEHVVADPGRRLELRRRLRGRKRNRCDLRRLWWPYAVREFVAGKASADVHMLEFGGGSTLWLEDQGARATVGENHAEGVQELDVEQRSRGEGRHAPVEVTDQFRRDVPVHHRFFDRYVAAADTAPDHSEHPVIADGRCRVPCVERGLAKVRRESLLLLDDSERKKYHVSHRCRADDHSDEGLTLVRSERSRIDVGKTAPIL